MKALATAEGGSAPDAARFMIAYHLHPQGWNYNIGPSYCCAAGGAFLISANTRLAI